MKHLKRLAKGLFVIGVFGAAMGVLAFVINYPWFGVPVFILGLAYALGVDWENGEAW